MKTKKTLEVSGWLLFTLGSAFFLLDGILQGNVISAVASGLFLLGCVFFLMGDG